MNKLAHRKKFTSKALHLGIGYEVTTAATEVKTWLQNLSVKSTCRTKYFKTVVKVTKVSACEDEITYGTSSFRKEQPGNSLDLWVTPIG